MFTTFPPHCRYAVDVGWSWKRLDGSKMVNRVASTVPVSRRVECLAKCTRSAVCDSFNYRPDDKTCQLNTYESSVGRSTLMQSPPTGLFRPRPLTKRASSTHTTLRSSPTRPTSSSTAPGAGGVRSSSSSCRRL